MKTPDEWLRDFETRVADARERSVRLQEGLAQADGAASSADGAIAVRVSPNGALQDIRLGQACAGRSPERLAAEIVAVARQAQRAAAAKVVEAFEAVGEGGSDTLRVITDYLPPPEGDDTATPPPSPLDDDGDFSDDSILRRGRR
ncbi:hypothetical protein UO65_4639 [Actinokineospora spheciospongiae]|uniref:YbaB/EbfC DNA-binding family protein n=1 Tax=Actinokineospora spheciospongiae TaxID=909613 RepID=W7IIQ1_9PSEU|nr:YbaB/EbfC family nucleoid-associated protein [Actinokineospora spheciospongiae]EWC60073.1 hypothetical protein UO65_4639 [Actinokineospora spheciospongiae]PWW65629.1 YbaB/EbfC DNA-binding family protein [Actinokineospora spheciospongiae]